MADAADKQNMQMFSNEIKMKKAVFDFAEDGGAVGVYDLIEMKEAMVIHQAFAKIQTDFTSGGGSATVEIGVKGGDTDAIMTAQLPTGAPAIVDGDAASERLYVAADGILSLEVKVEALTAGKLELVVIGSRY